MRRRRSRTEKRLDGAHAGAADQVWFQRRIAQVVSWCEPRSIAPTPRGEDAPADSIGVPSAGSQRRPRPMWLRSQLRRLG
ncbi:MAG TPA: hypothetical protein VH721_08575 [Gaiellaceae bacterium]